MATIMVAKGPSLTSLTMLYEISFGNSYTSLKLDPVVTGPSYSYTLRNGPAFLLNVAYTGSEWQLSMTDGQSLSSPDITHTSDVSDSPSIDFETNTSGNLVVTGADIDWGKAFELPFEDGNKLKVTLDQVNDTIIFEGLTP